MMRDLKPMEFNVYSEEGTLLGSADVTIDIQGVMPQVEIPSRTLYTATMTWGVITEPDEARGAILWLIETRTPVQYRILKYLFDIAGCDIGPYKWAPVDVRPGETMEHAYRRVALGAVAVSDTVEVVLVGPDLPLTNPDDDTLF